MSVKYLYEVAKIKKEMDKDLHKLDLDQIMMMIIGTTKSMGIQVVEDTLPPPAIKVAVWLFINNY